MHILFLNFQKCYFYLGLTVDIMVVSVCSLGFLMEKGGWEILDNLIEKGKAVPLLLKTSKYLHTTITL